MEYDKKRDAHLESLSRENCADGNYPSGLYSKKSIHRRTRIFPE